MQLTSAPTMRHKLATSVHITSCRCWPHFESSLEEFPDSSIMECQSKQQQIFMLRRLTACCHWKFSSGCRQQGSGPTVCWLAVFQDGGVHMQNMTSFIFITFTKINAKCQCYNCLNMLNMVLERFGGTLIANDVNKILWNKFIGTRWRFIYSCRQRTVRIERCIKSAVLSLFGSRLSAAAARTDTFYISPK